MGDRGNIAVLQSDGQVWFYTHWTGSEIMKVVRRALASPGWQNRNGDEPYLARIIYDHLVLKEAHGEETGYGISTTIQDNEHPIVVVDVPKQRVFLISEHRLTQGKVPPDFIPAGKNWWTFGEFAGLTDDELEFTDAEGHR